ncbi:3'-5' exonuclease [Acidaminococcus fermentans]|uniref:3'-5' exonuclease n=1 Tax=Acidaminococcus fermentans TaxID=905 RepID=UPI00242CD51C|nr:3'-5' exonuclease [Acidaminococcus fermentans]
MRRKENFAGSLPGTGRSLVAFPDTYVVVDLETTGLNPERDQIIEIELTMGQPGRTFSTLLQPRTALEGQYVSPFITQLTGITNEMLAAAPQSREALEAFARFLGSRVVVGYNVGFDMGFLQQQFQDQLYRPLANDWVDLLPMAQTLFPLWPHHRLNNLAAWYHVVNPEAHRALSDVETTEACFQKLKQDVRRLYPSPETFLEEVRKKIQGKGEGEQLSLW